MAASHIYGLTASYSDFDEFSIKSFWFMQFDFGLATEKVEFTATEEIGSVHQSIKITDGYCTLPSATMPSKEIQLKSLRRYY